MSTVFQDIREQLANGGEGEPSAFVATLAASECTNVTNMMKSMISEFVSHSPSRSEAAESQFNPIRSVYDIASIILMPTVCFKSSDETQCIRLSCTVRYQRPQSVVSGRAIEPR